MIYKQQLFFHFTGEPCQRVGEAPTSLGPEKLVCVPFAVSSYALTHAYKHSPRPLLTNDNKHERLPRAKHNSFANYTWRVRRR